MGAGESPVEGIVKRFSWIAMLAVVLMGVACGSGEEAEQPFERDPHSYSRPDEVVVTHLSLDLDVDFETRQLAGTATLTIDNKTGASELWLDTWGLEIDAADFGSDDRPTTFTIGEEKPFLGAPLTVALEPDVTTVRLTYKSSPTAA